MKKAKIGITTLAVVLATALAITTKANSLRTTDCPSGIPPSNCNGNGLYCCSADNVDYRFN